LACAVWFCHSNELTRQLRCNQIPFLETFLNWQRLFESGRSAIARGHRLRGRGLRCANFLASATHDCKTKTVSCARENACS
jgi:hypothetical protein